MNELHNHNYDLYDVLVELVADRQAELRREAELAGLFRNGSSPVRHVLLLVLGSVALLALLVTLGMVLA